MRSQGQYLILFIKGLAMGAADVVPGVSGGTIAFVSGIYIELINSIKGLNLRALKILGSEGLAPAWQHINGNFLLCLVAGIFTSLFSLANVMQYLLLEHPLPLWSFFGGLIGGSVIYLLRQHPFSHQSDLGLFVLGIGVAYGISIAPAVCLEGDHFTMFFAGSIALCAMILPGISGSFILVLLGLYPVFIAAIVNMQLDILVVFACGGLIGLMSFSRLLSWLLSHYQTAVIATMCGFLVGSLNIIWPWKQVMISTTSNSCKRIVLASDNLFPQQFADTVGQDPQTVICVIALAIGLILVLGLEYVGEKYSETTTEAV
jgi:putative membrane protein